MSQGSAPIRRPLYQKLVAGLILLCCWCVGGGCSGDEEKIGRVLNVLEGDLLKMEIDGRRVRVQLAGVDSPARGQPYREEARAFSVTRVQDKEITVRVVERGDVGHLVAEVLLPGGGTLNRELVAAGLAWHHSNWLTRYPKIKAAEKEARRRRRGLWRDDNPIPPWEFLGSKSWRD